MGTFSLTGNSDFDPNLLEWIRQAAANSPFNVQLASGLRPGDPRFHGKGQAADVSLIDPKTGRALPNYQDPSTFKDYQAFANAVRARQMAANPEYASRLRWGGYFSGGKGKYGAMDPMHFDTGGDRVGMAGGTWEGGLNPQQASLWGLTPGTGGGGGTQVAGSSPLATTMASAIDPRAMALAQLEDEKPLDFTSNAATSARRPMVGGRSAGDPTSALPDADPGIPPIETASATVTPDALRNPASPLMPTNQIGQLADLFQVTPGVGQAAKLQAGQAASAVRRYA